MDCVIVCGGVGIQRSVTREHVTFLQAQARQGRRLGAVCTGSWALARAGLLDGTIAACTGNAWRRCRKPSPGGHEHPPVLHRPQPLHSSGGTAPMDMMLHLIGREHGRELSAAISEMFIYERIRNEQDHQRVPLKHMLGTNQPKLQEIVALMEANLEEPIDLDELAVYVNVSRRQLERLFQKYLHCSPSRYLKLRLIRARQLLKQTSMSIIEVASVCGFVSTPHFSKCYREYFGIPPRDERQGQPLGQPVVLMPIPQDLALMPNSSALSALSQAQGESTFASVIRSQPLPAPSTGRAGPVSPRHQRRQQLPGNRLAHRRQQRGVPAEHVSTSRRSAWARSGLRPRTAYSQACSGVESGGTLKPSACRRSRKSSWSIRSACIIAAAPSMGIAIDSAEPTSLPARLSRLDMGRSFSANSTISDTATITSSGLRNAADGFRKTPDSH